MNRRIKSKEQFNEKGEKSEKNEWKEEMKRNSYAHYALKFTFFLN